MAQTLDTPTREARQRPAASVLVIEENEEHQILSVTALGRGGFRVHVAPSGKEGIRLAREGRFDVIVISHKLRDTPGLEVLLELQDRVPDTPKIFVVGQGAEELAVRALAAGASGYLLKTPRYYELLSPVVEEQLAKGRIRARIRDHERALKEAEDRFRQFMEVAQEPVFVIDPTGVFLAVNDATCATTGYARDELMAANLFDLLSLEEDTAKAASLSDFTRDGVSGTLLFALRKKDGTVVYLEVTPHLVRKDEEVVGIEALARDVTARRNVEKQLQEIYGWLRAVYEATNDAVVVADRTLRPVQWNARALELFEADAASMAGTTMGDLLRGLSARARDPSRILDTMVAYSKDPGHVEEGAVELASPPGRVLWRLTAPVRGREGALIGRLWTFRDITERRRIEDAARASEALFRAVFDKSLDPILVADDHARYVDANPAACKLLGMPRHEILARRVHDFVEPERRGEIDAAWAAFLRDGEQQGEVRLLLPKGMTRLVDFSARAHVLPGRHVSILRDVTERNAAEEELRRSEERFRRVFEEGPFGIAVVGTDTRILEANDALSRMLGYTREEMSRLTIADITHPDDLRKDEALAIQVFQGKLDSYELEKRYLRKDGTILLGKLHAAGVRDDRGNVVYGIGMVEDVTEKRRAASELEVSARKFRSLFEAAADAILLTDGLGNVQDVNPAGETLFGESKSDLIGKNLSEFLAAEDLERARRYVRDTLRGEPVAEPFGISILGSSGRRRFLEVRSRVVREDAIPPLVEIVARDVTERMEMERRLLESERVASMGRLSAYVAHEINTPLTSISLLTAGISRRVRDPEILAKLEKINVQRRLAATIISDLLRFSKHRPVNASDTDLRAVLAAAAEQVEPYRKDGLALDVDTEGPPVVLAVDPIQIQEVLVNLMKNALQATDSGEVRLRIEDDKDAVVLSCSDTGTGMTRDVLDRIFEPFFTTKRIGEGTGLGLAMCKGIVLAHGGTIQVKSEPGKGSVFTVTLPRRPSG